eukprot:3878140-Lingulodinium_polyedra.AAC.1
MLELIDRGFDAVTLAMAMQVHTAPRLLTKANAVSGLVWVDASILAGCRFSNVFARNALVETIHRMHVLVPEAPIQDYVDDLAQRVEHESEQHV